MEINTDGVFGQHTLEAMLNDIYQLNYILVKDYSELKATDDATHGTIAICGTNEYIFHDGEWEILGEYDPKEPHEVNSEIKVFSCPYCGGNQLEVRNGKRVCAFCGSELYAATDVPKSIPSVQIQQNCTNSMQAIVMPKPMPTKYTR